MHPNPAPGVTCPGATPPVAAKASTAGGQYLSFRLGAEEYGIDILKVQEIRSYEAPTRIASAPPFVKGVVNLRGVIIPIVDLRLAFALDDVRYDDLTVVIIFERLLILTDIEQLMSAASMGLVDAARVLN